MSDEEIEKLIKQLLSLISSDYNCKLALKIDKYIYPTTPFYICTYVNELAWQSYFVDDNSDTMYESFNSLNDMLQILLNPNYKLWISSGVKIPVAKKYGSTVEQLKIILDLKANI